MGTIFRYTLNRLRAPILGWGIGLFLLGLPIVAVYDVAVKEKQKIEELMQNFGPLITAFAGKVEDITSPASFLSLRYFSYMPLILGVFVVLSGSGLLAADEENGTLDLVLAHPVSRTAFFLGRLLAFGTALLTVLLCAWLGLIALMGGTQLIQAVSRGQVILPFLSLLAELLFFGTLAVLLSTVLPSRRHAAMGAGMVLVGSFFLSMLARVDQSMERFAWISPLNYYQSGEALKGLNGPWFGGLLAGAILFSVLAWWRFERRDIRVAGEGGWRLSLWRRKRSA
jgi:ABC-2 type transport system permease protein